MKKPQLIDYETITGGKKIQILKYSLDLSKAYDELYKEFQYIASLLDDITNLNQNPPEDVKFRQEWSEKMFEAMTVLSNLRIESQKNIKK